MLSAHQPYADYPDMIKQAMREIGCTAQVAGGVPAMCDGVTQGQDGMELSLLSRDLIAQCTAMSLSHQMFDGVLALGICDKIVPGLIDGCAQLWLSCPRCLFLQAQWNLGCPIKRSSAFASCMPKAKLAAKSCCRRSLESYHSAGTCTFYGTANSNQMVLEAMGLQLPGSSFVNPENPLRENSPLKLGISWRVSLPWAMIIVQWVKLSMSALWSMARCTAGLWGLD